MSFFKKDRIFKDWWTCDDQSVCVMTVVSTATLCLSKKYKKTPIWMTTQTTAVMISYKNSNPHTLWPRILTVKIVVCKQHSVFVRLLQKISFSCLLSCHLLSIFHAKCCLMNRTDIFEKCWIDDRKQQIYIMWHIWLHVPKIKKKKKNPM